MKKNLVKTWELLNAPFSYWRGLKYYKSKDWNNAEFYFLKAIESNPNHAYSNFKLGMCFFKKQLWKQAYHYISIAVDLAPYMYKWQVQLKQSEIRLRIKSRQLKSKKDNFIEITSNKILSSSAIDIEEQMILEKLENDSKNKELYAQLAILQEKQGKLWQSADSWKSAISFDNSNAEWLFKFGLVSEKLLRYSEASDAYQKAIELTLPINVPADWYYHLGFVNENEGHDNKINLTLAEYSYQKAIQKDKKLRSKDFGIGVFHASKRYWNKAVKAFEKQCEINKDNAELFYRLGFSYDRNYQWSKAEINYKKAISIDSKPEWVFRLGFVQERQDNFMEAFQNYYHAANSRKKYTPYWFYRAAYCLEKLGQYEKAVSIYLKLRKDQNLKLDKTLNNIYSINVALKFLNKQIELDKSKADIWYKLGNLLESQSKYQDAEDAYKQAIFRSNELQSLWYYRLGFVLEKQGKYQEACEILRSYRIMQRPHGVSEDILFKDLGYAESAIYSEYYHVLPVDNTTILYESFSGQGMSCNPYALFMYLFNHNEYKNWTHVWVINDKDDIPLQYKKFKNIIFISRGSDRYLRYLASAKLLINNSNFPIYFIRKPEQKFISTWHGTPFKTLGRDMEGRFFEHKNLTRNIFQATHLLSPNAHTSKILYERHDIKDIFQGKLIESGYPRVDITLSATDEDILNIRRLFNLAQDEKFIFYAPTWRGTHGDIDFDYNKLQSDLDRLSKLKGAKIIFRGHSLLQTALKNMNLNITVAPSHLDTNKILSATDILITDYSSVLFDYLPKLKPLILYMYDIEEYTKDRGLYFSENELPGYKCYDIEQLEKTIKYLIDESITSVSYQDNMVGEFAPHDDGNVSENVISAVLNSDYSRVKIINDIPSDKRSLLIYGGPFMGNGITTSVINLISNIDRKRNTITLIIDPGSIEKEDGRLMQFNKLPRDINIIARVGRMNMGLEERYIHSMNNQDFELFSDDAREVLRKSWDIEYKRVFGEAKFDSLIHFEGYNRFWAGVFSSQEKMNKSIFMHNSMEEEYRLKYPYLKSIFGYDSMVDKIVSVSELTMELNKSKLANRFNIPLYKFDYCNNLQQPELIIERANDELLSVDKEYFSNGGNVFLTIGRLSIEKDHAKLIKSFANVLKVYPNSRLLIVGDGPLKIMLTQLIQELNLGENVHLLGLRANPFPLLKNADCFVLPSNHEGQPMTLFEAMILEKMIIATDIVGSRSALEGRSGHLVENSIEGLTAGLIDFIEGRLPLIKYDINEYQKDAINRFYSIV